MCLIASIQTSWKGRGYISEYVTHYVIHYEKKGPLGINFSSTMGNSDFNFILIYYAYIFVACSYNEIIGTVSCTTW